MYREGKVYKVGNTKTEIYIMTHKEFTAPDLHEYIPLRVGAALSGDDFGYMRDDTGENISDKNPSYCELTGMYWVWKNSDCDVVGISHYRRYFEYDNDFLDEDTIGKILKGFDIIVPFSTYTKEGSIRNHYKAEHNIRDLEMIGAIIDEMCPEYKRAYDACLFGGFFNPFNMFVAKKEVYDSYCAWLFPILSELEKRVDVSDYDEYQSRVFGLFQRECSESGL